MYVFDTVQAIDAVYLLVLRLLFPGIVVEPVGIRTGVSRQVVLERIAVGDSFQVVVERVRQVLEAGVVGVDDSAMATPKGRLLRVYVGLLGKGLRVGDGEVALLLLRRSVRRRPVLMRI